MPPLRPSSFTARSPLRIPARVLHPLPAPATRTSFRVWTAWLHAALLVVAVLLLAAAGRAEAASLNLAWDVVTSSALRGYFVYYVPAGSGVLTQPVRAPAVRVDVGNRTTYTLANLTEGTSYQVAVTAYDDAGTESAFSNILTATATSGLPVADFTASTRTGVAPLALNFRNESVGSITSYAWTFGDGTTSTAANPAKTYSTPGTYTVSLRATGPAGSDTETKTGYITVTAPATAPVAQFSASTRTGPAPLAVTFTNQSTGTVTSYAWTFGDGTTSTAQNPTKTYSAAGTYTVSLRVTGSAGSDTETKTGYITVGAPATAPVAQFSASTRSGTAPLAVTFTNQSTGTVTSYAWTFGDGTTSTAQNPTKTYSAPGTYTVSLRVTGSAGSDTETKTGYITVAAPATTTTTLLSRTFNDGSLAGFRSVSEGTLEGPANWRVLNGEVVESSNVHGGSTAASAIDKPGTYLLYTNGLAWTDYRARFTMRSSDDDAIGFMFRYGDADNYYRFSWDRSRGYRRLVKKVNGTFTVLASDSVQYAINRNYNVEIVASGTTLEVWIDGARIFRVTDSARSSGTVAFYAWGERSAYFDNLQVVR